MRELEPFKDIASIFIQKSRKNSFLNLGKSCQNHGYMVVYDNIVVMIGRFVIRNLNLVLKTDLVLTNDWVGSQLGESQLGRVTVGSSHSWVGHIGWRSS